MWTVDPTQDRIKQNIEALPSILATIIAAGGQTVHEFANINNTGKRYTKLNSNLPMKTKSQNRDRKETLALRPIHADLQPVLDALLNKGESDVLFKQIDASIASATALIINDLEEEESCDGSDDGVN